VHLWKAGGVALRGVVRLEHPAAGMAAQRSRHTCSNSCGLGAGPLEQGSSRGRKEGAPDALAAAPRGVQAHEIVPVAARPAEEWKNRKRNTVGRKEGKESGKTVGSKGAT
jgi:hypothetical protein